MSRRWIQHPETLELIPRDEYIRPSTKSPYIMGDIENYISPLDGTVISDRRQHREHMQKHGVVPAQEYSTDWLAKRRKELDSESNSKAASRERKQMMWESWSEKEANR
jgi:hypothetical protein